MISRPRAAPALPLLLGLLALPAAAEPLRYDTGEPYGSYPDLGIGQAEGMRLTAAHPATVTALKLRFDKAGDVEIHLWADNGGQQPGIAGGGCIEGDLIPPVRARAEADAWLTVTLEEPVEVCGGCHVHVGHVVLSTGGPSLYVDTSQTDDSRAMLYAWADDFGKQIWLNVGAQFEGELKYQHYLAYAEVTYHDQVTDPRFTEVGEAVGLPTTRNPVAVDYDGDGDVDVLSGRKLFRNDGGAFTDVSEAAGLAELSGQSGVFADYDRDGDLDLYLFVSSCCNTEDTAGDHDHLLRNDGGVFTEVSEAAGLYDYVPNQSVAWGDFDNDGYPDIFLPGYYYNPGTGEQNKRDRFMRNVGDGTFEDASDKLDGNYPPLPSRTVTWADFDQDGWLDLFVGIYRLDPNRHYHNQGGQTLVDEATALGTIGVNKEGKYGHSIGSEWGDLDNDGDLDLVVLNLAHPRLIEISDPSMIYLNQLDQGAAGFVDVRAAAGVEYRETASGPALGDYDNDGDLDLFTTNVYVGRESNLWENQLAQTGALEFTEVSYRTGARNDNGWGAIWLDYDNDGDLDLLSSGLYRNDGPVGHWLEVRLVGGPQHDTFGLGATVTVHTRERSVTRLVAAGQSIGSQAPYALHFGLGEAEAYEGVTVRWLGGQVDEHPCGAADQRLVLTQGKILEPGEGCAGDADADGDVDGDSDADGDGDADTDSDGGGSGCGTTGGPPCATGLALLALLGLGRGARRRARWPVSEDATPTSAADAETQPRPEHAREHG